VSNRPYTPKSLAERWECSPQHVRKMLADGRLNGFKLGNKMWRISTTEVARIEEDQCEKPSSESIGANSASFTTKEHRGSAIRSARQITHWENPPRRISKSTEVTGQG
jgi:excisionase family DNA binding protein